MEPLLPERNPIPPDITELARVVYGEDVEQFLDTPRRSLGSMSPREAIADGEAVRVRHVLATEYEGAWA